MLALSKRSASKCGVLLLTSMTVGLSAFCIRSGVAEFPPNLPSATPSRGRFFFSAEFEAVPISLARHLFIPLFDTRLILI
jgi:hypothetical protein